MSIRRMAFYFLPILLAAILVGLPAKSQFFRPQNQAANQQETVLTAGRNVNMVSGTTLPGGDPWLQRQNEPSVAVSSRNPLHLLAGANDYRTVDMAASEGELPGISGAAGGDAWLGIFKSFDGGESWKTTLLPGSPLDSTPPSTASPIKGFTTAADPIVRAGTNGLFYYSGIAFNRGVKGGGAFFVARFIDNNNAEGGDAIKYLDTKIISQGTSGQFIDMPRIGVDVPRLGAKTVTVDGQTIQAGNVYAAYTVFLGNLDQNVHSKIMVTRSTDCGVTWGAPIKISESQHIIQGSAIAIDPTYGYVYVVFRRFKSSSETDAILICKSTDGGLTFTKPTLIANITPFDQPATDSGWGVGDPLGTSFRTNSYPAIAVDNQSNVYIAWADRKASSFARIVVATSFGGAGWTDPTAIDDIGVFGHQVMPFLTYASGKVMAVWYDQRNTGATIDNWISDSSSIRQTVDIRAAQAAPGLFPQFQSIQVSRYLWVYDEPTKQLYQGQWNPPNYPLFKGGTVPFHGDYVELTSAPTFIRDANGSWRYNTDAANPVFHAVWTDNRDVRPPTSNDWTTYNPPNLNGSGNCINPANTGMRNQNIYSSRLTNELVVDIPGNAKPLTGLGSYLGTSEQIPRAFVVYVKNTSDVIRVLRFHILAAPASGTASFMEFNAVSQIDTVIAPYSTVARTVFVKSTNPNDSATIEYYELDYNGNTLPGGLSGTVVLNADPSYPGLPQGSDLSSTEIHNPNIVNPNIVNWTVVNPNIVNPNIVNPNIVNPNIVNPNIVNPNIVNPNIVNPNIVNPNIVNPNIVNPNIVNPNIVNSSVEGMSESGSVNDVKCTVRNEGNTISAYTLKTFSKEAFPEGIYLQLLVYKTSLTPAINGTECDLKQEQHQELLLNVVNPNIVNPNIVNPNIVNPNIVNAAIENASFSLGPGEEAEVCLRVINPTPNAVMTLRTGQIFNMTSFLDSVGFATTAHAVNSEDARTVVKEKLAPKADASKLVIGTSSLPDGKVGDSYPGQLSAYGGTSPYGWSLTSGELPDGLHLDSLTGQIYGTPTTVGTSYFIVRVDDSAGDFDTQRYSIYVYQTAPAALAITTTSLPNGVKEHFYGATLEATGGVWPRTWSLASGSLPPGLSLDSGGVISGTPTSTGTSNFTVRVTDGANSAVTQALNLTIDEFTGTFFTISGKVYDGQGQPLLGAVMRGLPNTPVTDANGYYQDTVPEHWTGTVIPFFANVTFSPASISYTNIGQNQPNQDYNVPSGGYIVSGKVYYSTTTLDGIKVDLILGSDWNNPLQTTTSANGGSYSFSSVAPGSYNVKVNRPPAEGGGWTARSVEVTNANVTQDMDLPKLLDLLTPPNGATVYTQHPTLTWTPNPEASRYVVQINVTDGWELVEQTTVYTNSYTVGTALTYGTGYTWQVDADDSSSHHVGTTRTQFTFTPSGGVPPSGEMHVSQGPIAIPTGQTYDFGSRANDSHTEVAFTIANTGIGNLGLPGNPPVTISGANADQFQVTALPTTPVSPGQSTTFRIQFSPTSLGSKTAKISVPSSDPNRSFYEIPIIGNCTTGLIFSTFDQDPVDQAPVLGGPPNHPTELYQRQGGLPGSPVDGTIKVRAAADGITTQPMEISSLSYNGYMGSANYFLSSPISSGSLILEATVSFDKVLPVGQYGFFLQTITSGTKVVTRLWVDPNGIISAGGTTVGTYQANVPFRVRENINLDTQKWSVVIDNEMNGFADDPVYAGLAFVNTPPLDLGEVCACYNCYNINGTVTAAYDDIYLGLFNPLIHTVAGNGTAGYSGDGGPATLASLQNPIRITVDSDGNIFIADFFNHRIRKVDTGGTITTVAGNGTRGFGGDGGPATSANLNYPEGVAVDSAGNIYIADSDNHRIRKVDTGGTITTVAGNGTMGFGGDGGPATQAKLNRPLGIEVDSAGNIFIADTDNHRIRKVDTSGNINTVAGDGTTDFKGDGGLAILASLWRPFDVAVDSAGNIFIADFYHNRVRKVDTSGNINTVAGDGNQGFGGDGGPAILASLNWPVDVAVDSAGNIFIVDHNNCRIRKVDAYSHNIITVAGSGALGYNGDGIPATLASLNMPHSVAVGSAGNIFIADLLNHRIRKVGDN